VTHVALVPPAEIRSAPPRADLDRRGAAAI
jgi:hypothetical protein